MIVHIAADGTQTDVTEAVQVVYDSLHSSLDFGSGFLDREELLAMRKLARVAGFETPYLDHERCVTCNHPYSRHGRFSGHECQQVVNTGPFPGAAAMFCQCSEFVGNDEQTPGEGDE